MATTVQTAVTDQQGLAPFFYLRISGLPYYFFATINPASSSYGSFAWATPSGYPSGWNRGGMQLPDDTIEQKLSDIIGGVAVPSRARLSVMDFPDPTAPGFGFLSRLFAPGRFVSDSSITKAQLKEPVHAGSIDITVRGSGTVATFTEDTDVYVGAETIGISDVTGPDGSGVSVLTIADRNKYVCFGNTQVDADTCFPPIPYHRVALDPAGGDASGAQVTAIPGTILGRTAALWMGHMRPDGNPEPESSSACLILGRITNLDIGNIGGAFDITIESILADLTNGLAAPDLASATITPSIYLPNSLWASFGILVYMTAVDGSRSQTLIKTITVPSGTYSPASLAKAVNLAIQNTDGGDSDADHTLHSFELTITSSLDGAPPAFRFVMHQPPAISGAIVFEPNVTWVQFPFGINGAGLLAALGFDETAPIFSMTFQPASAAQGDGEWEVDAGKPLTSVFIPTRGLGSPASIEFALNEIGTPGNFFADQNDGSGKAYARFGDGQIVTVLDADLSGDGTITTGPSNTGFGDSIPMFYFVGAGSVATVEQIAIIKDTATGASGGGHAAFLGQTLASTTGQTQTSLNVFPEGVGMGWSAIMTAADWLVEFEDGIPRTIYLDRAMKFSDVFTPISREHGLFIVWDPYHSKIRLRTLRVPQPANADTFVFNESNRAQPGDRTTQRLDSTSLRTSWKIQGGWDWATQKWAQGPIVFNNVTARSNYPNSARQESIEDKTLSVGALIGDAIAQRNDLYGNAWTTCNRSVNKTGMLLAPGTIHQIVDSTMVNPYTGATGVTSSDLVYGFLTGISMNPSSGDVTATLVVNSSDDNTLYRPWSPVGLVNFAATSNGYVDGTKTLTMTTRYTNQSGKSDGSDFQAGDRVIVTWRDDDVGTFAISDEIASVSSDGITVVLVTGLGVAVSSVVESILILDYYFLQATTRKSGATRVAWQGDGDARMIAPTTGARLNKWG